MRKQLGSHFQEAADRRPAPKAKYDQLYATRSTVLDRVKLLREHGDLHGRDLLLIGDDDLLSIAIEDFVPPGEKPKSVTVLDIDRDLLEAIGNSTRDEIRTREYDVRKPLPRDLRGAFDTVFMDPPYTSAGQQAFLTRATAALRKSRGCVRSVAWTCYSRADLQLRSILSIQTAIVSQGFVIDEVWKDWNLYQPARRRKSEKRISGFTSDLFRMVRVPTGQHPRKRGGIYRYDK